MKDGATVKLVVQEPFGGKTHVFAVESDEFPIFSERFVEDIRAPIDIGVSLASFDTVVTALKQREFRRGLLERAATVLARRMADYLEDSEGWHGEKRRESIKARQR